MASGAAGERSADGQSAALDSDCGRAAADALEAIGSLGSQDTARLYAGKYVGQPVRASKRQAVGSAAAHAVLAGLSTPNVYL